MSMSKSDQDFVDAVTKWRTSNNRSCDHLKEVLKTVLSDIQSNKQEDAVKKILSVLK